MPLWRPQFPHLYNDEVGQAGQFQARDRIRNRWFQAPPLLFTHFLDLVGLLSRRILREGRAELGPCLQLGNLPVSLGAWGGPSSSQSCKILVAIIMGEERGVGGGRESFPGLGMRLGDRTWRPHQWGLGWSLVRKELSLGSTPCRINLSLLGPQLQPWAPQPIRCEDGFGQGSHWLTYSAPPWRQEPL